VRILIAKHCGLRGALALTPALRAIREKHPGARVTVVAPSAALPMLEGCPGVDVVFPLALSPGPGSSLSLLAHLRRQAFDHAFALTPHGQVRRLAAFSAARRRWTLGRPGLYQPFFHGWGEPAGPDPHEAARDHAIISQALGLTPVPGDCWFASSRMQEHGLLLEPGRFAVIHPVSADPARMLGAHLWSVVARSLLDSGAVDRIVVSCGSDATERVYAEAVCGAVGAAASSTAGRLRLPQLARLLADARIFLGVDTPVLQLAAAVRCPVVGVYGPSDYARARPWGSVSRSVRVDTTPYEGEPAAEWRERIGRAYGRVRADQITRAAEEVLRLA
jgi:heptosyltransferase-3